MAIENSKSFKVDKLKAHTSTMLQTGLDNLDILITSLATHYPAAAGLLKLAQASFGYYLIYKQEELNQFTEFLQNKTDVFIKQMTETKEFRDGFTIELEHYFKLRTNRKREIAQQIFLGFGQSTDKTEYPLERFNDTLEKISTNGLHLLAFIQNTIYPFREQEIAECICPTHHQKVTNLKSGGLSRSVIVSLYLSSSTSGWSKNIILITRNAARSIICQTLLGKKKWKNSDVCKK